MMMMIVEADRNARNIDVDVGIPAQVLLQSVLVALHFAADMIMMLSLNQAGDNAYRSWSKWPKVEWTERSVDVVEGEEVKHLPQIHFLKTVVTELTF